MTFGLRPSRSGFALGFKAFLHNSGMRACLLASSGAFSLQAGVSSTVEVVFDGSDECPTPVDIRNMAAVLEGTVEVASRQEWAIRYTLLP